MACCVFFPLLRRQRSAMARLGYRPLSEEAEAERSVTVVVGKEKREFLVDPVVIQRHPFRGLLEMMRKNVRETKQGVIFVDVDAILFEHLLWLMGNDFSSFRQLDLEEIVEFYAQDC